MILATFRGLPIDLFGVGVFGIYSSSASSSSLVRFAKDEKGVDMALVWVLLGV